MSNRLCAIMSLHVRRITEVMVRKLASREDMMETASEREIRKKIGAELAVLDALARSSSDDAVIYRDMSDSFRKIDMQFTDAAAAYAAGQSGRASIIWAGAQKDINRLLAMTEKLTTEQQEAQRRSSIEYAEYDWQLRTAFNLSLVLSGALAFGLAAYFNFSTTNRLKKLMKNTISLSVGKAPPETVSGDDELGQIDRLFHKMYGDLSVLRQRERALLDNAAEAIISINTDLKVCEFNQAAARLFGADHSDGDGDAARTSSSSGAGSGGALMGANLRLASLIAEDHFESVINRFEAAEAEDREIRFETRIKTLQGELVDTSWSVTYSREQMSLYCVIQDIRARKELERLKSDFVNMLSHDLRTPLNAVQASLEIASSEHFQLPPEVKVYLDRAQSNLGLSLSLINQLLELEKMEAGIVSLSLDGVSSAEIYNKACLAVVSLAESKKVAIKRTGQNLDFVGDADRLVQVMINLLGNALKFSPSGSKITVRDELRHDIGGQNWARISITDQGRGIPVGKLGQIFDRFQQVDPQDAREKAGSGLGLAICKAIVEAHGGRIGVSSSEGIGSTFWFELPLD
ncbi:MAG: PAS domain-containing sensor histidine kinase [Candidatus Obscuribacterales bacterium]|nr:PAS domain-containing sensor histidine kinase [Candidatus Obscuribacterales bacterium]